jgi:hypothetical protein
MSGEPWIGDNVLEFILGELCNGFVGEGGLEFSAEANLGVESVVFD